MRNLSPGPWHMQHGPCAARITRSNKALRVRVLNGPGAKILKSLRCLMLPITCRLTHLTKRLQAKIHLLNVPAASRHVQAELVHLAERLQAKTTEAEGLSKQLTLQGVQARDLHKQVSRGGLALWSA